MLAVNSLDQVQQEMENSHQCSCHNAQTPKKQSFRQSGGLKKYTKCPNWHSWQQARVNNPHQCRDSTQKSLFFPHIFKSLSAAPGITDPGKCYSEAYRFSQILLATESNVKMSPAQISPTLIKSVTEAPCFLITLSCRYFHY